MTQASRASPTPSPLWTPVKYQRVETQVGSRHPPASPWFYLINPLCSCKPCSWFFPVILPPSRFFKARTDSPGRTYYIPSTVMLSRRPRVTKSLSAGCFRSSKGSQKGIRNQCKLIVETQTGESNRERARATAGRGGRRRPTWSMGVHEDPVPHKMGCPGKGSQGPEVETTWCFLE